MALILARPRGSGTGGMVKEVAVGTPNGILVEFQTTFNYAPDSLSVFKNGLREQYITQLGERRFRFDSAPRTGTKIFVEYERY
jgi:hypothetical protein